MGAKGLWFSSFFLIPFDFVLRSFFHEKWSKSQLIFRLFILTISAAIITVIINRSAINIALASVAGFTSAQIGAGVFYQIYKQRSWFFKVNLSDLVAIIFDSIIFQWVAFSIIAPYITLGQIVVKFSGGLLWYFILFKLCKIQNKIYARKNSTPQTNIS